MRYCYACLNVRVENEVDRNVGNFLCNYLQNCIQRTGKSLFDHDEFLTSLNLDQFWNQEKRNH